MGRTVAPAHPAPWPGLRRLGHLLWAGAIILIGLFLFGLAVALMVRCNIGVAPWDVFHLGLARHLHWPIGQTSIAVGLGVIVLSYVVARIRPGAGTVANMFFIGFFTDLLMPHIPQFRGLGVQLAVLCSAVLLMGLGTWIYLCGQMGAGPRDALMLSLSRATGRSVRLARTLIEAVVLAVGWLLGGQVGLGTVIYMLGIGPSVQLFFRLLGDPAARPKS